MAEGKIMNKSDETVVTTRNGARVPASATGRPVIRWYCTTDRTGATVHVDACGDIVNGPSCLVHRGGVIECGE